MRKTMLVAVYLLVGLLMSANVFAHALTSAPGNLNISGTIYDPTPTFNWSSVSGATYYRLAIKQGSVWVVNPEPLPNTPYYTLPAANALSAGQCYTWTVRAEHQIGHYGPWAPAKSFCVQALATPTVYQPSGSIYDTTPYIDWSSVSGANYYRVAVKQGATWIWNPEPLPSASNYTPPASSQLTIGQCYTLNVRAEVEIGVYGPWSSTKNFCIAELPKVTGVRINSSSFETAPVLDWNTASGALRYRVAVKQGSNWIWDPEPLPTASYYNTPVSDRLEPGQCYTLNVRAEREMGYYGPWSDTQNFCIGQLGKVSGVTRTSDPSDTTPTFDWNDQNGALKYRVAVKQGSTWIWDPEPLPSSSTYTPPQQDALILGQCYTLNVRAEREIGNYGNWSNTYNFCIEQPNSAPSITVTQPNASVNTSNFAFDIRWIDSDDDSNADIELYYNTTGSGTTGTLIATGLKENDSNDSYTWIPKDLAPGSYYIFAKISDGQTTRYDYASHPVSYSYPTARPNILVIMTDDLDVKSFEQLLDNGYLPHIKSRLIDSGEATNFTNAFASNPLCCPSRATFFTGQYAQNHGVNNVMGTNGAFDAYHPLVNGVRQEHRGIGDWLNDYRGYFTAMIGKYKNGYSIGANYVPGNWDYWRGMAEHTLVPKGTFDDHGMSSAGYSFVDNEKVLEHPKQYQTRAIGERGIDAMKLANVNGQPFFVYLAPTAPHVEDVRDPTDPPNSNPWINDQDCSTAKHPNYKSFLRPDMGQFVNSFGLIIGSGYVDGEYDSICKNGIVKGCIDPELKVPNEQADSYNNFAGAPAFVSRKWEDLNCGKNEEELQRIHTERLEAMLSIDVMVGKLFKHLDDNGLTDDTVVIFTSDNGYMLGEHGLGNKGLPYEESIRVPLLIKPNHPPVVSNEAKMVVNIDTAATLLDYAGLPWTASEFNVDGRSMKPLLQTGLGNYVLKAENLLWRKTFLIEAEYPRGVSWCENSTGISWIDRPGADSRWWMFPDFTAVRTDSSFTLAPNMTYIEYLPEPTQASLKSCIGDTDVSNGPVDIFLYDLNINASQTQNKFGVVGYSDEVLNLKGKLELLKGCSGQQCRNNEQ